VPSRIAHSPETSINPVARTEPFDHSNWLFEGKFDGFQAAGERQLVVAEAEIRRTRIPRAAKLPPTVPPSIFHFCVA